MNQKLRTARSGIVILFAILSIVCLSLSLALSAHFAAYAEGESADVSNGLPAKDDNGNVLWQVHYTDDHGTEDTSDDTDAAADLLDGNGLTYVGSDGSVTKGNDKLLNYYAPYRGTSVLLGVELNPNYEKDGTKLSDLYDFDKAVYNEAKNAGGLDGPTTMSTSVNIPTIEDGGEALEITKEWVIVPLCNEVLDSSNYIASRLPYANESHLQELRPALGYDIVYHFQSDNDSQIIAIHNENNAKTYLHAIHLGGNDYEISEETYEVDEVLNYTVRRLNVGTYTLTVTALSLGSVADSEIYYASTSVEYTFEVQAQSISGRDTFEMLFGAVPEIRVDIEYPCTSDKLEGLNIKLVYGDIEMAYGKDYTLELRDGNVGWQDLYIVGNGNLSEEFVISNAVRVTPADNDWDTLPNITSWSYGDYDKTVNKIVGMPVYPNDINEDSIKDISFRIVSVDKDGNDQAIEGLTNIHYVIVEEGETNQYLVSDEVAALLNSLHAGNYRMYASVYGVTVADPTMDRNYEPVRERSIDFEVRVGTNSWGESTVPTIISWTAGKYNPEVNLITATDRYGNEALILIQVIKNGKPENVYSNHPDHANQEYGVYGKGEEYATKILKSMKAGYYTLRAEVKVEGDLVDYNGLNTLIDFTIARNGLPTWAVILIVVGSLAVVAVVFVILHEKGVLQMLTGKVIISMRTRANVDATIAAIRAAKVAREAEASIAAAKAREAEEAAKEKKD